MLSQSCTVVRSATKHLLTTLNFAKGKSSLETRLVLSEQLFPCFVCDANRSVAGSSGVGKSVLMLQIASQCLADGWIVMYIPRGMLPQVFPFWSYSAELSAFTAQKLVDSSTAELCSSGHVTGRRRIQNVWLILGVRAWDAPFLWLQVKQHLSTRVVQRLELFKNILWPGAGEVEEEK